MGAVTAAIPRPTEHGALKGEGRIDRHAEMLSEHHDRLRICEERLGIKPPVDGLKSQDQASLVKGNPGQKHNDYSSKDRAKLKNKEAAPRDIYKRARHA